ncbi:MAG: helix-turn-helix domain-containing protein [Reichenbachiella sp.]|uniref:helix-turn-helix domain-containing protein n=1 Tax=Reichenbachiella sp. TaxID=2184521 RepID=UPI003264384D
MKNKELATRIKALRRRKGFSQEELSEKSGLSLRTVQRIENGETEPLGDSLKKIADALNANPDELIDWTIKEDSSFLKVLNLSTLTFLFFPLLGILVPYMIWGSKGNKIKGIDEVGRDVINFQITWNLILFFGLIVTIVGFTSQNTTWRTLITSNLIFYALMYALNIFMILYNTLLIHNEKSVRYFPKVKFLR